MFTSEAPGCYTRPTSVTTLMYLGSFDGDFLIVKVEHDSIPYRFFR